MGDAQLVHRVQRAPCLALDVEQVHFAVTVGVLASNQDDLRRGHSQGRAGPKWVLHADSEDNPAVFVNVVNLDSVVDFLLGASEESSERVNEFVVNCAGAQIVALILHDGHLSPFVLLHLVLFDTVQALFAAEAAENEHIAPAHRDRVRIPALVHRALVRNFVFNGKVESCVFFGRRAATSDEDLVGSQRDGG